MRRGGELGIVRTSSTDSGERSSEDEDVDRLGSCTHDGSHLEQRNAREEDEFGRPDSEYLSKDEEERRLSVEKTHLEVSGELSR